VKQGALAPLRAIVGHQARQKTMPGRALTASRANQRLRLLSGHHPIKVLGVLVEILCFDRIAT
jgi:hypothetical protein